MPVDVRGLSFAYGADPLFAGFDFATSSRLTVLVGSSGCGKTTLLKILAGQLTPAAGRADTGTGTPFLVLQEDALLPWLSGWDNLTLLAGLTRAEVEKHVLYPSVAGFIDRRAHALSFGQRRVIELLRSLAYRPRLLLLDEPLNFLDPELRRAVARALAELPEETECVLSTHHADDLRDLPGQIFRFPSARPLRALEIVEGAS